MLGKTIKQPSNLTFQLIDTIPQICTEILYQPLTLLDCLHTFCGSCLKEWFSWQASRVSNDQPNPYTCPSCRASVRETRPNATVTTLLDMYLQANPGKARSEEEKGEAKRAYTLGEPVLPKIEKRRKNSADEADRRMIEEVREMSLQEVGVRDPGSYERGTRHRNRDGSRGPRDEEARRQRRDRRRRDEMQGASNRGINESSTSAASRSQARQIEHQASLRSLLSNSHVDSSEMEEEILRQIMEEGLLDGIDLDSLDLTQQDELSERIADAYRRRHGRQSRSQHTQNEESRGFTRTFRTNVEQPHRRQHGRLPSTADQIANSSHPPVSRPRLLEVYPSSQERRRRTSSDHRRQTSPVPGSSDVRSGAARSATDLSERPRTSATGRTRHAVLPSQERRITDPEMHRSRDHSRGNLPQSPRTQERTTTSPSGDSTTTSMPQAPVNIESPIQTPNSDPDRVARVGVIRTPPNTLSLDAPESSRPSSSSSHVAVVQPVLYPEPSIKCHRCDKPHLEYELHQNCSSCLEGNFNLCLRCYRRGEGCLHWYGFGNNSMQRYERQAPPGGYPANHALPHVLIGHRYARPVSGRQPAVDTQQMTSDNPAKRLQSGVFCSNCSAFANDCFWKCNVCNEGEWGFCNSCVNQGKSCTHPLLPLAHSFTKPEAHPSTQHTETSFATNPRLGSGPLSSVTSFPYGLYTPLTFSTKCDICTYPIPPSSTRFHCLQCNAGDYDICTTCYMRLVSNGRITSENGYKGWRRCLKGHRMIVTGFQDSPIGQRRIVVNELVGGHALKDDFAGPDPLEPQPAPTEEEWKWRDGQQVQARPFTKRHVPVSFAPSTTTASASSSASPLPPQQPQAQQFPPDGGIGMKLHAKWSYWPNEGVENELAFPKGAVVVEAEDINGDWFWGVYAGAKGLFPGSYGRVIEVVGL